MTRFHKMLIGVAAFGLLAAGAIAQSALTPNVGAGNMRPTQDLVQIIPLGAPSAQSKYVTTAQLHTVYGFYKSANTFTAGNFFYNNADGVTYANFYPSTTVTTAYFGLALTPSDGQLNCFFSSAQVTNAYICNNGVTNTTMAANGCTTTGINSALAGTLSANSRVCYLYGVSTATWDRVQ